MASVVRTSMTYDEAVAVIKDPASSTEQVLAALAVFKRFSNDDVRLCEMIQLTSLVADERNPANIMTPASIGAQQLMARFCKYLNDGLFCQYTVHDWSTLSESMITNIGTLVEHYNRYQVVTDCAQGREWVHKFLESVYWCETKTRAGRIQIRAVVNALANTRADAIMLEHRMVSAMWLLYQTARRAVSGVYPVLESPVWEHLLPSSSQRRYVMTFDEAASLQKLFREDTQFVNDIHKVMIVASEHRTSQEVLSQLAAFAIRLRHDFLLDRQPMSQWIDDRWVPPFGSRIRIVV